MLCGVAPPHQTRAVGARIATRHEVRSGGLLLPFRPAAHSSRRQMEPVRVSEGSAGEGWCPFFGAFDHCVGEILACNVFRALKIALGFGLRHT